MSQEYALYPKQEYAYSKAKSGNNIFLTGSGGVGKSVLVNKIRSDFEEGTVFVTPTGVSALNIGGSTIHRQFKFPIGFMNEFRCKSVAQKVIDLFRDKTVSRIVIDEISMVRSDLLKAIDINLRYARRSKKPFGGIQIIVVGDFFQLPPVLQENTSESEFFYKEFKSPFCFTTDSWIDAGLEMVELDRVMRTSDTDHISLLQEIRIGGKYTRDAIEALNHICYDKYDQCAEDAIVLCATNRDADSINTMNYIELPGEEKTFYASIEGDIKLEPAPKCLDLKYGARVMMIANDINGAFMNGQLGYVVGFESEKILVLLDNTSTPISVDKNKWDEQEYYSQDGDLKIKITGSFTQYPIKLAYAVTIHKSQGISLDSAHINLGRGAFAHGQAYVALSRLRSMYRMNLMQPLTMSDIIIDPTVIKFYHDQLGSNLTSFL